MSRLLVGALLAQAICATQAAAGLHQRPRPHALLRRGSRHARGLAGGVVPLRQPGANPVVGLYRKWTFQYEKDAEEAEKATKLYQKMTQDVIDSRQNERTAKMLAEHEMHRIGVATWAHATYAIEGMLHDPKPPKAAKAAAAAAAPFNKAYKDYEKAKQSYDVAAQGYGLRVGMDESLSKKLATYSNQYALEGNKEMSDEYKTQATLLMKQAETFRGIAKDYHKMASKIFAAMPVIQGMAGTAANFAAWKENPTGAAGPEHVFPFTVVPPLEFMQVAASEKVSTPPPTLLEVQSEAEVALGPPPPPPLPPPPW